MITDAMIRDRLDSLTVNDLLDEGVTRSFTIPRLPTVAEVRSVIDTCEGESDADTIDMAICDAMIPIVETANPDMLMSDLEALCFAIKQ